MGVQHYYYMIVDYVKVAHIMSWFFSVSKSSSLFVVVSAVIGCDETLSRRWIQIEREIPLLTPNSLKFGSIGVALS